MSMMSNLQKELSENPDWVDSSRKYQALVEIHHPMGP
jgi:hypothetical protein